MKNTNLDYIKWLVGYADAWKLPKAERAKLRSKTFPGIAKAMAGQWGKTAIHGGIK